jgi:hypothetical protein
MNKLLFDLIVILSTSVIYFTEYCFQFEHTIIATIFDLFVFVFMSYRLWRKEASRIWFVMAVFPIGSIVDFGLKMVFGNYLHVPEQYVFLGAAGFFLWVFVTSPAQKGDKKILLNHTADKQDIKDAGQYPVYVNPTIFIPEQARYTHLQVIGATGSGKTRFIFYPHIIQDIRFGNGVFIFDIKSNMRERIEDAVVYFKRDMDYCYFNLGDKNSMTYNPLAGDNPGEIANRVFTALYYDMAHSEQFYIDIAKRFLPAMIAVLMKKYKTITFEDLYWMTVNPRTYLQPICNEMPNDINARYLIDFMKKQDLDKNLIGLVNKLAQFTTPDWAPQINTLNPEIDITKIITEGKIFLFQANSGIYQQEYKPISILLMMHIQSEIAKRYSISQEKLKPFFIYLDEFDKIVYPGFSELINKAREAKVGLIFGHQSLGDLKQYGETLQNQILTNARNKIVLKVEDPATAEYFSKTFGTKTIERRVNSYNSEGMISGSADRREEEFNVHPNTLKFLKLGEACVKIEGGVGGKTYINVIELKDISRRPKQRDLYRPGRENRDIRTTNVLINEQKGENLTGKSGGLKWKHIKANNEEIKKKEGDNNEENNGEPGLVVE